jgi:hypothetical protein
MLPILPSFRTRVLVAGLGLLCGLVVAPAQPLKKQEVLPSLRSSVTVSPMAADIGLLPTINGISLDLLLLGLLGMGYGTVRLRNSDRQHDHPENVGGTPGSLDATRSQSGSPSSPSHCTRDPAPNISA